MNKKPIILWCCDVFGWAFSIRAEKIGELLPHYKHVIVYNNDDINISELVESVDIIVPTCTGTLSNVSKKYDNKIISLLTSRRSVVSGTGNIIYYTDNTLDKTTLGKIVWNMLLKESCKLPIIVVSQKPFDSRRNVCVGIKPRNPISIMEQILIGLEELSDGDYVFLAEHDVLYNKQHFIMLPQENILRGQFNYNTNYFRCTSEGYGKGPSDKLLSACSGFVGDFKRFIKEKIVNYHKNKNSLMDCLEPGRNNMPTWYTIGTYTTSIPNVDIRHKGCVSIQMPMMVITKELEHYGNYKVLRKKLGILND